jgi:HlyD family secretion protein
MRNALTGLDIRERELANIEERAREKLLLARANADYWQKQKQRFERLKKTQSVSGEQYEKTRLQSLDAQAALFDLEKSLQALAIQKQALANQRQALELNEKDLILTSPVNGTVMETFVTPGEPVFPGTAIADILDEQSLYVEVFVEEKELAGMKLEDHAEIEADGSAEPFSGAISFFGKKAEFSPKYIVSEKERQSLLYQVKVRILTGRERLKLGMPVTVVFHD